MLDLKFVCENIGVVKNALKVRNNSYSLDKLVALSEKRLKAIKTGETLKAKRNQGSEKVAVLKREKKDASAIIEEMKMLGDKIKKQDEALAKIEKQIKDILFNIPNIPHSSVPVGKDDSENLEMRRHLEPTKFAFAPKAHWDLAVTKDIIDFEVAAKITGSRFSVLKGKGAKLERAIINFLLDKQTEAGYTEIHTPVIVNENSMIGTGQLPKFAEDMFALKDTNYYLIPTAEVSLTNLFRDEIVPKLPVCVCGYSLCFRKEAGSAGRDTRGLVRQHQFSKIELVKIVEPETSMNHLESLTNDAENILKALELPYRTVLLCTGDMGFNSAKTYDLEVWMPSYNRFVEISSCSNFLDYQARRANIKYKDANGKLQLAHTLNGSGLAVGRLMAAIIENYQDADGNIKVPKALQKYLPFDII